jgi:hypothetical protein
MSKTLSDKNFTHILWLLSFLKIFPESNDTTDVIFFNDFDLVKNMEGIFMISNDPIKLENLNDPKFKKLLPNLKKTLKIVSFYKENIDKMELYVPETYFDNVKSHILFEELKKITNDLIEFLEYWISFVENNKEIK